MNREPAAAESACRQYRVARWSLLPEAELRRRMKNNSRIENLPKRCLWNQSKHAMIDYISGRLAELSPTNAVIENQGIGYIMEISLQTYEELNGKAEATLYIQRQVNQRDGIETDYGFATKEERNLFRSITSVSGMGASSARMILSSLTPEELQNTILSENVARLKSIKGIGLKSAQRLILELKDKIVKGEGSNFDAILKAQTNADAEEAATALQNLGFAKPNISKAIQTILKQTPDAKVEDIIKAALKML